MAAETKASGEAAAGGVRPGIGRPRSHRRARPRGWFRRNLRWIVLVVLVLLAPVAWSYGHALTAPGSEPWTLRSIEWVKDHGGRSAVVRIEDWWYTHHKPPVGGRPSGGIPALAGPQPSAPPAGPSGPAHLQVPPDIRPIASPALPHEGHWQPIGRRVAHLPTMYAAFVRPDAVHTSLLTTVVWMDTKLLRPVLYAGTQLPGGSTWHHYAMVPPGDRSNVVSVFNSGFALRDTRGGWYSEGRMAQPLVTGGATMVIYRNGSVNVGTWGRDVHMTPDVVSARQNLALIVDHGRTVPGLATANFHDWGATYGGAVLVWRSGIGVDRNGGLIYAAGDALSAYSLGRILQRAGAVRAMELDINHTWMSFNYFSPDPHSTWGVRSTKMLDNPYRTPFRYLTPDERDFFAMFLRPGLTSKAGTAPGP